MKILATETKCRARLALVILPPTHHPCFQLQLYVGSAAIIHRFSCNCISSSLAFCHPFHVYIEALVPYRINRVLILDCLARHKDQSEALNLTSASCYFLARCFWSLPSLLKACVGYIRLPSGHKM